MLASARLPLLGFSLYFCLFWAFCYALCWLAMQSCSLVVCVVPGAFLKAVYAGYHGYALPEARVCWVCWGDCRGSLLAIGWPQGHRAASLKSLGCRVASLGCVALSWRVCSVLGNSICSGHPQSETSLRVWVWVWVQKISLKTLNWSDC